MQDLTLVGVHEDGEHLVLTDAAGQRYRVRIDESLRAAVRRDRPRLAQLQVETEGLRPREIQARIRAGQTAEEIAEAARIPLEHVRRFEGPVLAEREFVATQARGVRLRRPGSSMTPYTLGELVQQRLAQREVDDAEITWDAWREDDGTWVVCLSFHAGSTRRRAHWTYDTQLRHVAARDDEARWFTEEERPEAASGQRRLTPIRDGQREPARGAVRDLNRDQGRDQVYDLEADEPRRGGDRYPQERHAEPRYADARQDPRTDPGPADPRFGEGYPDEHFHPERYENVRYGDEHFHQDPYRDEIYGEDRPAEVRRATVDLLDTLRERRGRRQHLAPADPGGPGTDAVDAAVETLRARAESLGEGSAARTTRHREGPDPEAVRLPPDDVIELPDTDDEPARRRTAPAGASGPGLAAPGAPSYPDRIPERGSERPVTRPVSPSHPAAAGKRTVERQADRESGSRSAGPRTAAPRTGSVPAAAGPGEGPGPVPRPAPRTAPVPKPPAASGRGPAPRGTVGSGTAHPTGPVKTGPVTGSIGRPSPTAPPAQPRDRDPGAATPGQPETPAPERPAPARRNKRASVPSWDDIVFGSRRE